MADDVKPTAPKIELADSSAPTISFDAAPMSGVTDGLTCSITLTASRWTATDGDGNAASELVAAGYLRASLPAMLRLRDAIDSLERLIHGQAPGSSPDIGATLQ